MRLIVFSLIALVCVMPVWAGERADRSGTPDPAGLPVVVRAVEVGNLPPHGSLEFQWRGYPFRVVRRTGQDLERLRRSPATEAGSEGGAPHAIMTSLGCHECIKPDGYAQSLHRSPDPEYFVMLSVGPHYGCYISYFPPGDDNRWPNGERVELGQGWTGGFHDPCHHIRYDLAGRPFPNSLSGRNLFVPRYRITGAGLLIMGE